MIKEVMLLIYRLLINKLFKTNSFFSKLYKVLF